MLHSKLPQVFFLVFLFLPVPDFFRIFFWLCLVCSGLLCCFIDSIVKPGDSIFFKIMVVPGCLHLVVLLLCENFCRHISFRYRHPYLALAVAVSFHFASSSAVPSGFIFFCLSFYPYPLCVLLTTSFLRFFE